jgi:hypothetical protein
LPLASVSTVPAAAPLSVIVTPANATEPPPPSPPPPPPVVTVPEMAKVAVAVPVKFWAVTFAPLIVTFRLTGLKL